MLLNICNCQIFLNKFVIKVNICVLLFRVTWRCFFEERVSIKLRLLERDRDNIFGNTENAVAFVRLLARDTTARFCSLLQNCNYVYIVEKFIL